MRRNPKELLEFIFKHMALITAIYDNNEMLKALANMGRDIVHGERCTIWLFDARKQLLFSNTADGYDTISMSSNEGIVGSVVNSGEPVIINNAAKDEHFDNSFDRTTGFVTKKMIVVPTRDNQQQITGAIQVINTVDESDFTGDDLNNLKLISVYISETIKTTLLLEEIEANQKELMYTFNIIADKRSKETGNHLKRVSLYSRELAQLIGLSPYECDIVADASTMHDIGKIAIPDAILEKPAKLTDEEYEIIKNHTVYGYEMFARSKRRLLQSSAIIAHEHHEKYDGTGYPRGLIGEDIHIFGRIVALADVFDALASKRIYKESWSYEDIFGYIGEQRGKHFDPMLVDLFLEHKETFINIHEQLRDESETPEEKECT